MAHYEMSEDRYTDRDVRENPRLALIAEWYALNYTGDFPYMKDMRDHVQSGIELNVSAVRGIMNCLRNDPHMAGRVPSEIAFTYNAKPLEGKLLPFPKKTVVLPPRNYPYSKSKTACTPCEVTKPHESHYIPIEPGSREVTLCPGVPFEINRKREVSMRAKVKPFYMRARTSGIFHNVTTKKIAGLDYEGYIDWNLNGLRHKFGYGRPTLWVYTGCPVAVVQNPCLYWDLPDFKELSALLGIETRRCKKCFTWEQDS